MTRCRIPLALPLPLPLLLVIAVVLFAPAPAPMAADEKHQLVKGVSATYNANASDLSLELSLANGTVVRRAYTDPAEVERMTRLLDLASREGVRLYVDLAGRAVDRLRVEFGRPAPFVEE